MTINNNHRFSKGHNGFQISPRMQELMVYAGQMDSYDNCNEINQSFINVRVSTAQVYRLTDLYGASGQAGTDKNTGAGKAGRSAICAGRRFYDINEGKWMERG